MPDNYFGKYIPTQKKWAHDNIVRVTENELAWVQENIALQIATLYVISSNQFHLYLLRGGYNIEDMEDALYSRLEEEFYREHVSENITKEVSELEDLEEYLEELLDPITDQPIQTSLKEFRAYMKREGVRVPGKIKEDTYKFIREMLTMEDD